MKAVILNSADKLAGVHGSRRTILDGPNGVDWTQSEAYNSLFISLDDKMGAGELNARRAMQQFAPGESDPGNVPLIGWDYGTVGGAGSVTEYYFDEPLVGDKYIAATLVWDRRNEHSGGNVYSYGDQFFNAQFEDTLNNLDLYLMPADADPNGIGYTWASRTWEDNVEHIFFNNFDTGDYKIVLRNNTVGGIGDSQNYALAWWFGDAPSDVVGDYDNDGDVNEDDYLVWNEGFGSSVTADDGADGNGDGIVDAADYVVWRKFADAAGSGSQVPEPHTMMLFAITCIALCGRRHC